MIRLGLVGYPLEHSLSPRLHRAALGACGLRGEYSLYPVAPGDASALAGLLHCLRTGELAGLNVTIPHKQAILRFLDDLTPAADAIGAANTIYLKDGKLMGDNTDAPGFLADLGRFLPGPQSALVLGAGGSARAVVYALYTSGWRVTLLARRVEQASELAQRFSNVKVMELNPLMLEGAEAQLIVNTTPVGMFPDTEKSPWPAGIAFPENAAAYDLVYNPRETLLVRRARAAGLKATTGIGMLVEQAALAFELWTGCLAKRSLMLAAISEPSIH
jgi:shikimate dehydrogenase